MKKAIRDSYVEGLIWNFKYYNKGCPSWEWYYPYHFPPLPSELACLADFPGFVSPTTSTITVTLSANGEPVKHSFVPLSVNLNSNSKLSYEEYPSNKPPSTVEQLLSVLPPSSAWYLPEAYRNLMLDPFSPMSDMYACEYVLDRSSHSHFNHKLILPAIRVDVLCQEVSRIAKQHPDEPRLLHGTPMIARRIPTEATTPVACSPNSSSSSTTINPPSPSPVKFDLLGQYPEGVSHRGGHCIVCQKRKFDPPEHHSLFRSSHPKPQTPGNRSISKNPTPTAQHPHTSSEAPHPWTAPSALSISNNVQWCVYSPPPFPKHSPFMHELIPGVRLGNHREVAAKDALKAIEKSALSKSLLQIVESLFSGGTTPVEGNLPYSAAGSIGNNPALAAAVGNGNAGIATTTTTTSSGLILRGSGVAGGGLALNSSQLTGNGMGVTLQRAVVRVKSNFE